MGPSSEEEARRIAVALTFLTSLKLEEARLQAVSRAARAHSMSSGDWQCYFDKVTSSCACGSGLSADTTDLLDSCLLSF